ncbi:MAG TPA: hypothetical protein VMX17_08845, partial [Candidatus Glassbacteria bacterium]|nr:hypothetical protein [Candidatus Glassbacteria bacterium]
QQKLKETGTTGVRAPQIPVGFTGKVAESFQGQPQQEKFYVKGKEVGRIVTPVGEKPRAVTTRPSQFVFRRPSGETQEVAFKESGAEVIERTQVQVPSLFGEGLQQRPVSTISEAVKPEGLLERWRYDVGVAGSKLGTQARRGGLKGGRVAYFGVGIGSALLDQALGIKSLVTKPVETIKAMPSSIKAEATQLGVGLKSGSPEYSIGRITGFYAGSKGIEYTGKGIVKVSDVARTKGTINIPTEQIVAPEYFKGQTYPVIAKGQTAGTLLQEFKSPIGAKTQAVTQLRGFTASPKPIKAQAGVLAGSSEIKGLYQAPKLSPKFLRVASEEKTLFTLKPFGTFRPSASIVKPTAFELTPYVKPSQRTLAPLKPTQRFFDLKAEKGKSYVTFVKTEKESIIPAGTPLTLTEKRFSFKFEGRKVPIYEFEIGDLTKVSKDTKAYSTQEVIKSSSYKVGKKGVTSPYDILKVSRSSYRPSYKSPKSSYSIASPSSSAASYIKSSSGSPISSSAKAVSSSRTPSSSVSSYPSSIISSYPISSARSYRGYGSSYLRGSSYTRTPPPPSSYKFRPGKPKSIFSTGKYKVFGRRFGKFLQVGAGRTPLEAVGVGQRWAKQTLGVTWKVPSYKGTKVPGFRTKKTKEGTLFIEPRGKRLKKGTKEIPEIQYFKRVKGGRKKK